MVPIWGFETKIGYKRWTRVWEEMVLVKMLMEIDPLSMRGWMVMTMAMISPSRRDVSRQNNSAKALDWSTQVPPQDDSASSLKPLYDYFQGKRHHIAKDGHRRPARGPTRSGGAPSTLVGGWWPPSGSFFSQYFLYIPKISSVKFQDFWSCAE